MRISSPLLVKLQVLLFYQFPIRTECCQKLNRRVFFLSFSMSLELVASDEKQSVYPPSDGTLGAAPALALNQNSTTRGTNLLQPISLGNALPRVSVQDGEEPKSFETAKALADYLYNDQSCRVFKYNPKSPTSLLMPLFEHFDFPRFSLFPYGFANDFCVVDHWGAGSCKCQKCVESQLCGHYPHRNRRRALLH